MHEKGLFALSQTVPDLKLGDSLQERASSPLLPQLKMITPYSAGWRMGETGHVILQIKPSG